MKSWILRNLTITRRIAQLTILAMMFIIPYLNVKGFTGVIGTFYSMEMMGIPIVDPALCSQTLALMRELYVPLLLAVIIPLLAALALGRIFCSWACPFNTLAEYAQMLRLKLSPNKRIQAHNPAQIGHYLATLCLFMLALVFTFPVITFLSMPGLLTSQAADLVFLGSLGLELGLFLIIILAEVVTGSRFWCKYACPVGATLSVFRTGASLKVTFDASKCTCQKTEIYDCQKACPLSLNPRKKGIYPYCYNCGACIDACQRNGRALSLAFIHQKEHVKPLQRKMEEVNG